MLTILTGLFAVFVRGKLVVGGALYLSVFKVEQWQALAYMFLKLHAQAYNISLVFFGFYCLLINNQWLDD